MSTTMLETATREWTAAELRGLLPHERDAILADAAKRADDDYTRDRDLTAFEALGEEDLHGRSSNTVPR